MILPRTITRIGPRHHGCRMTLKAFEFAETEEGSLCELARGYIVVSEVPGFVHMRIVGEIRMYFDLYRIEHRDRIYQICGTMECKLLMPEWESERHPDVAVYLTGPKNRKDRTMWRTWAPELVIEVVSESSRDRDYTEKRDEYWTLGVKEYWIVDAKLERVVQLRRGRAQWIEKTLGLIDVCETKLLPGFQLSCRTIFEAAKEQDA
jgi:Uma2 family endonuclease